MSAQLTLGVVGHVDHGKTALVRVLTGIETDRLAEERERGLSMVLGFSFLELPGRTVDLVDAPGHEDFIRAMISGATGIHGVVLVVAANEGVMPQTREHFHIARLLGVDTGVVVLTKTDLVTEEEALLAEEEINDLVVGSFLEGAPVVRTSSVRGEGLEALRGALAALHAPEPAAGIAKGFFLPVDRVFSKRGFGTVATGTLRGGTLRTGETVEILPAGATAAVRGLENHSLAVETAFAGQRVAVNLRNLKRGVLGRGDVIATPEFLNATRRLDVELSLLRHAKGELKNAARVRVLFGTTEAIAKVRLLDRPVMEPGTTGLVQLRLQREVATRPGERFIVRDVTPVSTMGGGRILDVDPPRHRRFDDAVVAGLRGAARGDAEQVVRSGLAAAGLRGAHGAALRRRFGISSEGLEAANRAAGAVDTGGGRLVARSSHAALMEGILAAVGGDAGTQGLTVASLRGLLDVEVDSAVLQHAVEALAAEGRIRVEGGVLRCAGRDPLGELPARERRLAQELEEAFRLAGLASPPPGTVLKGGDAARKVYGLLGETGALVRLRTYDRGGDRVLHRDVLSRVKERLRERFPYPKEFSVAQARDLLDTTRKHVVPLLEHLDATGVTTRTGSMRRLRER